MIAGYIAHSRRALLGRHGDRIYSIVPKTHDLNPIEKISMKEKKNLKKLINRLFSLSQIISVDRKILVSKEICISKSVITLVDKRPKNCL